jgi:hypothetical protein
VQLAGGVAAWRRREERGPHRKELALRRRQLWVKAQQHEQHAPREQLRAAVRRLLVQRRLRARAGGGRGAETAASGAM